MDDLITTTEAAELAGVGVSSIKRWADRKEIRAIRTPGGHRRVDKRDLLRFLRESSATSGAEGKGKRRTPRRNDFRKGPPVLDSPVPALQDAEALGAYWADAMQRADVYELQALLLTARSRRGSWSEAADEAALGLGEIGMRWQRGDITVMEEHVASERLSRALAAVMNTMPRSHTDPVCLLSCVTGDTHTLGLSFLQLCLRERGWQPLWVGATSPMEELCSMAASGRVDMIAISASAASANEADLAFFADAVGAACMRSGTRLVLGGSGPWPVNPPYGKRLTSFTAFSDWLAAL